MCRMKTEKISLLYCMGPHKVFPDDGNAVQVITVGDIVQHLLTTTHHTVRVQTTVTSSFSVLPLTYHIKDNK